MKYWIITDNDNHSHPFVPVDGIIGIDKNWYNKLSNGASGGDKILFYVGAKAKGEETKSAITYFGEWPRVEPLDDDLISIRVEKLKNPITIHHIKDLESCRGCPTKLPLYTRMGFRDNPVSEEVYNALIKFANEEPNYVSESHSNRNASSDQQESNQTGEVTAMNYAKNLILYGPPGTGKTYSTVIHAVAIVENKKIGDVEKENYADVFGRYKNYLAIGLINFVTFHQNYGYEDFIEGIRPVLDCSGTDNSQLGYKIEDGIFKRFCSNKQFCSNNYWILQSNPSKENDFWKFNLGVGGETSYLVKHNDDVKNRLFDVKEGDFVLAYEASGGEDRFMALCVVTKVELPKEEPQKDGKVFIKALHLIDEKLNRKDLQNCGLELWNSDETSFTTAFQRTLYKLSSKTYSYILERVIPGDELKRKVFIIDEINRGNISKIFGELITLIEDDKREGMPEARSSILPYSKMSFSVPSNVYILGTMNTADRSLTRLDTALRRRFEFEEMMPKPELLDFNIEGINIKDLLTKMNERIEALYDREHQIGHAYFWKLKQQYEDSNQSNPTMNELAIVMKKKIIPLLQEYFFDDWEKIRLVLGDNQKNDEKLQFITCTPMNVDRRKGLFGAKVDTDEGHNVYAVNSKAFDTPKAYEYLGWRPVQDTDKTSSIGGENGDEVTSSDVTDE